jgi:RND family efflux transporter MFP subunit
MNLLIKIKNKISYIWRKFLGLPLPKKILAVIVILAVVIFGYKLTLGKKSQAPQYQTTQASRDTLITSVTSSGTISSASNVSITTQVGGTVRDVYVKNGDYVTAGQSIADITLDQDSAQKSAAAYANFLQAQNNVNSAQANINSLQSALFKANQTFINDKGNTPNPDTSDPTYIQQNADWLQAQANYKNQQGVISAAQAALTSASLSYSQLSPTITAPISGTISNLNLTPGLAITATSNSSSANSSNTAQSVGNIKTDGSSLQASVNLSEIDVTKIQIGQKATLVLDAFPDKTFTGKVSSINTNGSVSSGVTTYPAIITFDTSPDNVYPNMAVTATIITDVKTDVLLVPSSAVQTTNGQSYIRVLKNGKITNVNVETGEENDTQTEIISGLNEGDSVVTGMTTPTTSTGTTTSPFGGGGGFGGAVRTGGGGGNATFRRAGQ